MKHREYIHKTEQLIPNILNENLLFWNLWCLQFVFEHINKPNYKYMKAMTRTFELLWEMNDSKSIDKKELETNEYCKKVMMFNDEDYINLDDFNSSEKAIKEFMVGIQNVLFHLKKYGNTKIYTSHEHPINLIDMIVDRIYISEENTDPIYLNEVTAQFKLLEELTTQVVGYTLADKNIFRETK